MNVDTFFRHYQVQQNPFSAEEARLDPVFDRLIDDRLTHPDFDKILGKIDQPSTAVVFGEKGSGKTAIRLLIEDQVAKHNARNPDRRILTVTYDDLNPVLDNLMQRKRQDVKGVLKNFRLEDHQDTILSLAITKILNALVGPAPDPDPRDAADLPDDAQARLRKLPRQSRADLALLAALYDQPHAGDVRGRFDRLLSRLRLGWDLLQKALIFLAIALPISALAFYLATLFVDDLDEPWWLWPGLWALVALTLLTWGYLAYRWLSLTWTARKIHRETPSIRRSTGSLAYMLGKLGPTELARQPLPLPSKSKDDKSDARYQLTRKLSELLAPLGYRGMLVLVDRVDEPTIVSGDPEKMQPIIWPMFDNKFLQQNRIGMKLLLPVELRYMLRKEGPQFFQEARLDKQNMIDKLEWTGTTLYDLCSSRLRSVRPPDADDIQLTDLFEESVTRNLLIDALDQMHQPRDAFKFLYRTVQEHCKRVPEDAADFKIERSILETVRNEQSQRVQELYRGLTPA